MYHKTIPEIIKQILKMWYNFTLIGFTNHCHTFAHREKTSAISFVSYIRLDSRVSYLKVLLLSHVKKHIYVSFLSV